MLSKVEPYTIEWIRREAVGFETVPLFAVGLARRFINYCDSS